jgi:UPF0716 family protein affecting phage T7 exclusion
VRLGAGGGSLPLRSGQMAAGTGAGDAASRTAAGLVSRGSSQVRQRALIVPGFLSWHLHLYLLRCAHRSHARPFLAAGERADSAAVSRGVRFLLSHQNENGGWGEDFSSCYDKEYAPRGAEDYGTVSARERERERGSGWPSSLACLLLLRLSFVLCLYVLCASDGGLRVSDLCCCYNLLW